MYCINCYLESVKIAQINSIVESLSVKKELKIDQYKKGIHMDALFKCQIKWSLAFKCFFEILLKMQLNSITTIVE